MTTRQFVDVLQYNEHTIKHLMTKMRKTGYVTTEKGRNYLSGAGTTAFKAFSEVFKPTLDTMLKEMMKEAFRQRNEHIKNGTTPA